MEAHDAAEEFVDGYLVATGVAEESSDLVLGGIGFKGIENVSVGGGVSGEDSSKHRDCEAKIGKVNFPPEAVARFGKIEHQDSGARY